MKLYVIAGHGQGDPGACANGYSEAERVRGVHHVAHNERAVVNVRGHILFGQHHHYCGRAEEGVGALPPEDLCVYVRKLAHNFSVGDGEDYGRLPAPAARGVLSRQGYLLYRLLGHGRGEVLSYAPALGHVLDYFVHGLSSRFVLVYIISRLFANAMFWGKKRRLGRVKKFSQRNFKKGIDKYFFYGILKVQKKRTYKKC